jgi:inhibitor of cysteine peptidase
MKIQVSALIGLLAVLCFVLLTAGCTSTPPAATTATPTATPAPTTATAAPATAAPVNTTPAVVPTTSPMKIYNESANGTTVNMTVGSTITVQLKENPTTGYTWNATVTKGLVLTDKNFTEDQHAPNMTGVGGIHTWDVKAAGNGTQKFSAIYKRSWEPTIGNETTYILNILAQ